MAVSSGSSPGSAGAGAGVGAGEGAGAGVSESSGVGAGVSSAGSATASSVSAPVLLAGRASLAGSVWFAGSPPHAASARASAVIVRLRITHLIFAWSRRAEPEHRHHPWSRSYRGQSSNRIRYRIFASRCG
ncbi:hypothetical protein D1610_12460 [Sphingomonas gilva]|uniref:Uncharacterized protein n=1 Tax=Sphingomonas gilva TaxID=2305907 RepID=A0A396RMP1_9SPHN|nr:hypothetical protein D1610_12460 [Sphingomonas gilva]